MSDNTSIEWTRSDDGTPGATWNVVTGCTKVSPGCDNCLAPETRVLRADMTWVPIADIKVGDRLVSFTDKPAIGQNRVWEEATVQAVWETHKPTVTVELANGATFTASEDHLWLIAKRGASQWWRKTVGLNFKTEVRALQCSPTNTDTDDYRAGYIAGATEGDGTFRWDPSWRSSSMGYPQSYWRVAKPEQDVDVLDRLVEYLEHFDVKVAVRSFSQGPSKFTDNPLPMAKVETRRLKNLALIARLSEERSSREWMAGWLAGMFDTDASYSGGSLRFCQSKPNDVLDKVERYGKELGFDLKAEHYEGTGCPTVRLMGGIAENIAFLSSIHPALTRRCRDFYGKRIETPTSPVVGIRRGSAQRLIDITTSTGTFVAEGALTHNCYAETFAERWRGTPGHHFENGFDLTLRPERMELPLKWRKPRKVFVNSMSDLFHEQVPDEFIARVFAVMALAPQHTFQILTKRHGRMRSLLSNSGFPEMVTKALLEDPAFSRPGTPWPVPDGGVSWPLPNVHLGVSAEDQRWADIRIPALLQTPAAVRWVSIEPLLNPLSLRPGQWIPPLGGGPRVNLNRPWEEVGPALDWCVVGGESGPGSRRLGPGWVRHLVEECQSSGTPIFVKQMGAVWASSTRVDGRSVASLGDRKGGDPQYWPADLRVREFPRLEAVAP